MRSSLGILMASLLIGMGSGCATLFAGKTATVHVQSTPPGASVLVDGNPVGGTPGVVQVSNKSAHQIRFQLSGYEDAGCTLTTSVGAGWVILDVFLLVSIIVDAVTGDWSSVDQVECVRTLRPAPGVAPPAAAPPPRPPPPPPPPASPPSPGS